MVKDSLFNQLSADILHQHVGECGKTYSSANLKNLKWNLSGTVAMIMAFVVFWQALRNALLFPSHGNM